MIEYLAIYFAIGTGLVAAALLFMLIRDGRKALTFPQESPWIVLTTLLVVLCAWPAVVILLVFDFFKRRRANPVPGSRRQPKFRVEPQHLICRMSIAAIEAQELVYDPLGAVPDLPFGHLNEIWRAFSDQLELGEEIWGFEVEWQSGMGMPKRVRGYAVLRDGTISKHLVAGRQSRRGAT